MAKILVKTSGGKSFYIDDKNEIQRGGEGRILLLPSEKDKVAKIYHPGIKPISEARFNQLQKLDKELFLKPIDLILLKSEIIGFVMEYAGSNYFPISSLFNRSFCLRNAIIDDYKTKIANKLIEAVKQAHFNGFVIGDLNQYNVLADLKGNLKLIDIDSYETPGNKHTGVLLDDIRDYYYKGIVSMNSDYFALSVILFYLFTYTHPFKGIHQKYKTLADRMIHQIPVFVDDPLLTVPKCYEAVENKEVQTEFEQIYINGERFLFSVKGTTRIATVPKPVLIAKHQEDHILINVIFQNSTIINVRFNHHLGYIETSEKFIIFSARDKGYLSKKNELSKADYHTLYLGNETIIAQKNNQLFHITDNNKVVEITNFKLPENSYTYQLENVLIVVGQGQMFWLYLDEVLNHSIRNKRIEVFTEALSHHNGLIQNTGGVQRMFYHTGKDLATVKLPKKVKQLFQKGNTGIIQYIENDQLINQYFRIDGLNFQLMPIKPDNLLEFGLMPGENTDGFIFEPEDNMLLIRRINNIEIVSEIKCSKISRQSTLMYTKAGIIVWEQDKVFLLNQK
ncbi:MAG: hypothetical protein P1P88_04430 [Bacteroidales bacterium]|nr:hypothetical protein [Bacteroidales bacterium]